METIKNQIASVLNAVKNFLTRGKTPYIFTLLYIAVATILVYLSPRSVPAFLMLMSSALFLFYLPTNNRFKLIVGLMIALLIMPVIGVRNIFYLEVIFQISVFAALALGLNIVVGFAG
ncbi:branched-chain amino acid ABC transporter permease, partial [bacterium]|nr:branched-chain amino acid ABC transporter permease [bacterium]